jgi:hypothetical protein
MEITLSKAIEAHGQRLTKLDFREPLAGDLMKAGVPFKIENLKDGATRTMYDAGAIGLMISQLAAIPTSSVATMAPSDFMKCAHLIINFTAPGREPSSTEPSS